MRLIPVLLLLGPGLAAAAFAPAVRLDQENRPGHACYHADIAGQPGLRTRPIYCAFEDDSVPFTIVEQRHRVPALDRPRPTWLPQNVLIRRGSRFACYPDLKVGPRRHAFTSLFTDRHRRQPRPHSTRPAPPTTGSPGPRRSRSTTTPRASPSAGPGSRSTRRTTSSAPGPTSAATYLRVYSDVSTDAGPDLGHRRARRR